MGSIVRIEVPRAERESLARPGTVRNLERYPMDVELLDLSVSGALLACDAPMPLGAMITLGIPGAGMHAARVSRIDDGQMACAFFPPLEPEDVRKAKGAATLVKADFDPLPVPHRDEAPAGEPGDLSSPEAAKRLKNLVARTKREQ